MRPFDVLGDVLLTRPLVKPSARSSNATAARSLIHPSLSSSKFSRGSMAKIPSSYTTSKTKEASYVPSAMISLSHLLAGWR